MNVIAPKFARKTPANLAMPPATGACEVWVRKAHLTRFRNYEDAAFGFDARPVILLGSNGAGKTNLMEAISLLAPGRGLRRAGHEQFCKIGAVAESGWQWAVSCEVVTDSGAFQFGTGVEAGAETPAQAGDENARRVVRMDGAPAPQMAVASRVGISWLTPSMDGVLASAAGERRRFLDRLVIAFDPAHAGRLTRQARALRQRNHLLEEGGEAGWLAGLEHELAAASVAIIAARLALVSALNYETSMSAASAGAGATGTATGGATASTAAGSFPAARLRLCGEVEDWLGAMPAVDVEERISIAARDARQRGETSMPGAHQSFLEVRHAHTGLVAESSSTGEQKALVISVILAHARLQNQRLGRPVILLLDDIVAHLDAERRLALFAETAGLAGQVWFSGIDHASFAPIARDATLINLEDGVQA